MPALVGWMGMSNFLWSQLCPNNPCGKKMPSQYQAADLGCLVRDRQRARMDACPPLEGLRMSWSCTLPNCALESQWRRRAFSLVHPTSRGSAVVGCVSALRQNCRKYYGQLLELLLVQAELQR
mmetsp:Transcript_8389/g.18814  ORF Transcript_8389/g.18814 Transcript_8389/m.18814 type:complete len:123 (-) Transcript_8389:205-573(-)